MRSEWASFGALIGPLVLIINGTLTCIFGVVTLVQLRWFAHHQIDRGLPLYTRAAGGKEHLPQ